MLISWSFIKAPSGISRLYAIPLGRVRWIWPPLAGMSVSTRSLLSRVGVTFAPGPGVAWTAETGLPVPDGLAVVTGPAHRRRHRRDHAQHHLSSRVANIMTRIRLDVILANGFMGTSFRRL